MSELGDLPPELLSRIIELLILRIGSKNALPLRNVNRKLPKFHFCPSYAQT